MSTSNTSLDIIARAVPSDGIAIPVIGRFWLFLISNVLSLACGFFLLFHLVCDSTLRHGLHNHVIIAVLCLCLFHELTVMPWEIHFLRVGVVPIKSPTMCLIIKFIDTVVYTSMAKLVGWASVERHILIFHSKWIATKMQRILIHYIPLMLIIMYGIILYGITTPINDCGRGFYYNYMLCAYWSCVYDSAGYSLYEFMSGGVLSSICIGFGSAFLIIRIITQKRRLQQQVHWRKYRKMTIQLLSVTSIFFIIYLPPVLLGISQRLGVPSSVGSTYSTYANFFSNYVVWLFPFTCLGTLPQLRTRVKTIFRCFYRQQQHRVVPLTITVKPMQQSRV
ncbi:unnamed protein product [Adineta steineri]|uniref:G-protein coupled receptors family 1 profile domain-containing protein n=1 Tax=Adineta steineri TaxID=433720 RepID=A0A813UFF4_9BILA|nr:unnamed protein product [Adineta steineri]CAF4021719.1 unnamed protein product [Adineta steineri]